MTSYSLCSKSWPWTLDHPAFTSEMLGLPACTTTFCIKHFQFCFLFVCFELNLIKLTLLHLSSKLGWNFMFVISVKWNNIEKTFYYRETLTFEEALLGFEIFTNYWSKAYVVVESPLKRLEEDVVEWRSGSSGGEYRQIWWKRIVFVTSYTWNSQKWEH